MRLKYLGDSYDVVKQSLLRWLHVFGAWSVLPMFTETVTAEEVEQYALFLGASVVSASVLTSVTDRTAYFLPAAGCGHLLLDPNTGLRLSQPTGHRNRVDSSNFVFAGELVSLSEQRMNSLTLTFDQSLGRGSERTELERKLQNLLECRVHAFAYHSHACFIVCGTDRSLVERARREVLTQSRLPEYRLIAVEAFG